MEERNYGGGREEGITRIYYETGGLREEQNYQKGKLEGRDKIYYENGTLKAVFTYKNDKLNGIAKRYYLNGDVNYVDTYKDNQLIHRTSYDFLGREEISKSFWNLWCYFIHQVIILVMSIAPDR